MTKQADYHARLRTEIGEEAYLARMAAVRQKRTRLGGPWRLDYVDPKGRTGPEIAAEAGSKGRVSQQKLRKDQTK